MSRYADPDKCRHRIKRRFTHGRSSVPKWDCKDCGKILTRNEMQKRKQSNRPRERKVARRKK